MATLRNLRNILKAKIPDELHFKVAEKISNQKQVENSKMFPLQFFNALSEVDKVNRSDEVPGR